MPSTPQSAAANRPRRHRKAPARTVRSPPSTRAATPPASPTPSSPTPSPIPLDPEAIKKAKLAAKVRDVLLSETASAREKLNLPRGQAEAGVRFDKNGIKRRVLILAALVHPDKHPHASTDEKALWTTAFQNLQAAAEELQAGIGSPRGAGRGSPGAGVRASASMTPVQVFEKMNPASGEVIEYYLSGTHTVFKIPGTSNVTATERITITRAFLDYVVLWQGPLEAAGFFMEAANTRDYAIERGDKHGNHHVQDLTGVRFCGEVEQAAEVLIAIWKTFVSPVRGRKLVHIIHDKGDNRSIEDAFGYVAKACTAPVECFPLSRQTNPILLPDYHPYPFHRPPSTRDTRLRRRVPEP